MMEMSSKRFRSVPGAALVAVLSTVLVVAAITAGSAPAFGAVAGFVRVDQVGFAPNESKQAYLMTSAPVAGAAFAVIDARGETVLRGRAGASLGSWNPAFPAVYPLDLSRLRREGTFRVRVSGPVEATSPPFPVAPARALFGRLVGDAIRFYQAQRDGADVVRGALDRQPSHLNDRGASVYADPVFADFDVLAGPLTRVGGPVDVEGGWFDAGDFLKFTNTTAYADLIMLLSQRDLRASPRGALAAEARHGLEWLGEKWGPPTRTQPLPVGD